ncbi:MAG: alpha-ribazole phosphatase family protein [Bacteroidales bacterium]|nr:alpha-ribazole phosphatase family protein [Bacteroidales bacterium]
MEVILVRHTTPDVPKGTCYGFSDVDVTSTFTEEATQTLRNLQEHLPVDKAYTSPLQRARKLAEFCGFADAEKDPRLKEMNMGQWEMQNYNEIQDPALQEWYKDYMHLPTTGGESFPDLYRRVKEFLDELKSQPYRRVAVFSHAGPIVSAAMYAGLCTEDNPFGIAPTFGGILKITI